MHRLSFGSQETRTFVCLVKLRSIVGVEIFIGLRLKLRSIVSDDKIIIIVIIIISFEFVDLFMPICAICAIATLVIISATDQVQSHPTWVVFGDSCATSSCWVWELNTFFFVKYLTIQSSQERICLEGPLAIMKIPRPLSGKCAPSCSKNRWKRVLVVRPTQPHEMPCSLNAVAICMAASSFLHRKPPVSMYRSLTRMQVCPKFHWRNTQFSRVDSSTWPFLGVVDDYSLLCCCSVMMGWNSKPQNVTW